VPFLPLRIIARLRVSLRSTASLYLLSHNERYTSVYFIERISPRCSFAAFVSGATTMPQDIDPHPGLSTSVFADSKMVGDNIYNTSFWGDGYFKVTDGNLSVVAEQGTLKLTTLVEKLKEEGVALPALVRFDHILRDRVSRLCNAFQKAREKESYEGQYVCVYPIKVNQQRWVVEELIGAHNPDENRIVGLEAGSKPELMACLALMKEPPSILVCNGYKDREYIRLALAGTKLGLKVFIVIEKMDELPIVIEESKRLNVRPNLGLRARLDTIGLGKWQNTGGEKSKFGLNARKILASCELLAEANMLDCLTLLHFHMGSQVSSAKDIEECVAEAANVWASVRDLGAPLSWLDVGGGLGVDYEGTRSRSTFSINYSVDEYAAVIVRAIRATCDQKNMPHPNIITESGRNLTAHHACVLVPVLAIESPLDNVNPKEPESDSSLLTALWGCYNRLKEGVQPRGLLELFHQVDYTFDEVKKSFPRGVITIKEKATAETLYVSCLDLLRRSMDPKVKNHQDILDEIHSRLAEKLFLNFSIFQSIPDKWGIAQIFPVMPLKDIDSVSNLRRGKIQDITCDSDGQIDDYVDGMGIEQTFPMPSNFKSGDVLGLFLVGAYQEILGDMHNLFGDTHAVNIAVTGEEEFTILGQQEGDSIEDVLNYVKYDVELISKQLQDRCISADVSDEDRKQFEKWLVQSLKNYVYLK